MRKGIMSMSPLGRKKAMAKAKTNNMEKAEKAAVQDTEEPQELNNADAVNEKNFVQTIYVPKKYKSTTTTTAKQEKSRKNKPKRDYVNT